MKNLYVLYCIFLLFSSAVAQPQKRYEDKAVRCAWGETAGRKNGAYVSYYPNGVKKAEGTFENNYRSGRWTVWDSTGRMRMQRIYRDPFTFYRLVPAVPDEKPVKLLNVPRYALLYNQEGYIRDFYLEERMVLWAKYVERLITPETNPLLFEGNLLFDLLKREVLNGNMASYSVTDKDFRHPDLSWQQKGISKANLIGFRISEEVVFDCERFVSQVCIISISPLVVDSIGRDTTALFQIRFSDLRKYLAKEQIRKGMFPAKVKTLDDLFFFRCFYGQIIKEANPADRSIADYCSPEEAEKERERIEISIIEEEHDLWISLTK